MGNLEHNIKEAFAAQDSNTKLVDKGAMWNRLDNKMHSRKGVAALWRVAAILLGVFLLTGAFAALNSRAKKQAEIEQMERENASLQATIDSLRSMPVATKIEIIEKEKIVYRNKPIKQQNSNSEKYWEKKYQTLSDSSEFVLARNKKHVQEITQLNENLARVKQELSKLEQSIETEMKDEKAAPFRLKSERVDVGISKIPTVKNSEMKMKVLEKNFIENRNNLNSTIFKK